MAVKKEESQILTKSLGIGLLVALVGATLAGFIFSRYMDGFTATVISLVCFYLIYVIWRSFDKSLKKKP